MLRRKECRDSTSTPPLRSNLSFTRRRVILAQKHRQRHGSFPANTSVLLKKSDESRTQNTPDPRYLRRFSRAVRQKLAPRIFSTAFTSSSSGRHLGSQTALPTVARCTVAMWTDGRSARPLTWARRTQVRVFARTPPHATPYASTPRLPESAPSAPLTRRHSACRDPGSDADPPPSARRPRRQRPARRVHRTRGRRVPHAVGVPAGTRTARTRAFAKRVTKTRSTTWLSAESSARPSSFLRPPSSFTFSSPSRLARSPSRRRRHDDTLFNHPHRLTGTHLYIHSHVTSHTSLPTSHAYYTRRALRTFGARCARR